MMTVRKMLVDSSKYDIKCPYPMTATRIVVHNTANDASANNEVSYMIRNDNQVSFHYAVDDKEVVQGLPENRNAWASGDGATGKGNREGIHIEICYSKSGGERFIQAEKNAAKFIAQKLKEKGWGMDKVTKHQDYSAKYCPHRTLDMGWDRFKKMIQTELNMLNNVNASKPTTSKPTTNKTEKYSTGTPFTCTGLWTQANGGTWVPKNKLLHGKGDYTIGKVYTGTEHPYQALKNGTVIGFANDKCIDDEPSVPSSAGNTITPTKTARQFALEVWNKGMHGKGEERKANAERYGLNYDEVQRLINVLASGGQI